MQPRNLDTVTAGTFGAMIVTGGDTDRRAAFLAHLVGVWAPLPDVRFVGADRGELAPVAPRLNCRVDLGAGPAPARLLGQVHSEMFRRPDAAVFTPTEAAPLIVAVLAEATEFYAAPAAANLMEGIARMGTARGVALVASAPGIAELPAGLTGGAAVRVDVSQWPAPATDTAAAAAVAGAQFARPVRGVTIGAQN
ncbi:hypothetical protein [Nocardia sp. NPDC051750]|uniref:hypothetical protein n=1 Tax=Nocardia sp. NPDC051750 TaxID=3364325 RepID=UPI0037890E77